MRLREAFGETAPLPIALWYGDTAVNAESRVPRCMIGTIRKGGRRAFLGMFDPSARPLVPKDELTFAVPMCRFREMLHTMPNSALYEHAFSVVRYKINGEIK